MVTHLSRDSLIVSLSDIFGANGDVLIMFLPYDTLVELPYKEPPSDWATELSGITHIAAVAGKPAPPGHGYYKIMAGTTNDQFRQWCFDNKKACLPLNVIMVEVTSVPPQLLVTAGN